MTTRSRTALFIGRFQPFHMGHASVLHAIKQDGMTHVIIGIGSAQYSRTQENPFTFDERKKMIEAALSDAENIPSFEIVAIDDIHNPSKWVEHVNTVLNAEYDTVYSGNPLVQQLFQETGKRIHDVDFAVKIDGSTIRHMIENNNPAWRDFVHLDVAKLIDEGHFT